MTVAQPSLGVPSPIDVPARPSLGEVADSSISAFDTGQRGHTDGHSDAGSAAPDDAVKREYAQGEPDGRETEHFGARHRFFVQTDAKDQLNRRREILKHSNDSNTE